MSETSTTQTYVCPIMCGSAPFTSGFLGLSAHASHFCCLHDDWRRDSSFPPTSSQRCGCGLWMLYRSYELRIMAERHGLAAHMNSTSQVSSFLDFFGLFT